MIDEWVEGVGFWYGSKIAAVAEPSVKLEPQDSKHGSPLYVQRKI